MHVTENHPTARSKLGRTSSPQPALGHAAGQKDGPTTERARVRAGLAAAGRTMTWLLLAVAVVVLLGGVLVPRILGATPYTVLTGSMSPSYPPGTLIVIKPAAFEAIGVGDVITYQIASGKPTVVTHRVVAAGTSLDGDKYVRTQGDANPVADADPVYPVQVRGKLIYALPHLGYVSALFSGEQRQVAALVAAGGLSVYAALMYYGSVRDRATRKREERT